MNAASTSPDTGKYSELGMSQMVNFPNSMRRRVLVLEVWATAMHGDMPAMQ